MRYAVPLLALAAVTAAPLAAQIAVPGEDQTSAAVTAAAASISAADLARHIGVIAADSMQGRATPSRGLEATAHYIADQFKKLGLLPNGDQTQQLDSAGLTVQVKTVTISRPDGSSYQTTGIDTSFIQRYPLVGNMTVSHKFSRIDLSVTLGNKDKQIVNNESSQLVRSTSIAFATDAFFATDTVPHSGARGMWESYAPPQAFVVAGPQTLQSAQQAKLQGRVALYLPHERTDSATRRQIVDLLRESNHVLILSDDDSATFATRWRAAVARPALIVDRYMEEALGVRHWAVYVRSEAIQSFLAVAGLDLADARASNIPIVRELTSVQAQLDVEPGAPIDSMTAPNVIGFIPGSDTSFNNQYIVYSAHMDHTSAAGAGADHAAGVAGLIELAKAFRQPDVRPKRSVLFVALSGGAKDFSGANFFVRNPLLPSGVAGIAINIKIGPIGRNSPDSIVIDGVRDLELSSRPDWIAAQHPDLKLDVADGGTISTATTDHLAFIRRALPSLYFHSGAGDVAGAATKVDPEHAARALRLAFYFGRDLANASQKPGWTAAGRRDRVRFLGQ